MEKEVVAAIIGAIAVIIAAFIGLLRKGNVKRTIINQKAKGNDSIQVGIINEKAEGKKKNG